VASPEDQGVKKVFAARTVSEHRDPAGMLGIAMVQPHTISEDRTGCLLDLDFFTEQPADFDRAACMDWMRRGHDVVYQAFRSWVRPDIYERFEPRRG